jgi:uncharacterized protein CbrC (UPF0167 family)
MSDYILGDLVIEKKDEISALAKQIMNGQPVSTKLVGINEEIMLDIIKYHPDPTKSENIEYMYIKLNEHNNRQLMLKKKNVYKVTDVSIIISIRNIAKDGKKKERSYKDFLISDKRNAFDQACRNSIKGEIVYHINNYFGLNREVKCQLSGELILRKEAVVHHDKLLFKEIIDKWIDVFSINVDTLFVGGYEDGSTCRYFNNDVAKCFRTFHGSICNLMVIAKKYHNEKMLEFYDNKNGGI